MEKSEPSANLCTSVFKEGQRTTKERFTQKWIELISRLEKTKESVHVPHMAAKQ